MNIYVYIHQGWIYPSPLPPFQEDCPPRPRGVIAPFSVPNASRSPFATTFLHRLLLFLLSKPFRNQNLQIFDPPRPSKSSIFIERVVIFKVFEVLRSKALLDPSWRPSWPHLGPSWGLLGASWRPFGGPKPASKKSYPPPFKGICAKVRFRPPKDPPKDPQEAPKGLK